MKWSEDQQYLSFLFDYLESITASYLTVYSHVQYWDLLSLTLWPLN